jgi:hypothetical protein
MPFFASGGNERFSVESTDSYSIEVSDVSFHILGTWPWSDLVSLSAALDKIIEERTLLERILNLWELNERSF